MKIFPAVDIIDGKAVRLLKGDYDKVTVYGNNPVEIIEKFISCGAKQVHMVDLDGARSGGTPNIDFIKEAAKLTFVQTGGGIRDMKTVENHLNAGVSRVILGTAAVECPDFLRNALREYGDKIAVGVDIKNGSVATRGWENETGISPEDFFSYIESLGVATVICTDVSRDGAMKGTNLSLYETLKNTYSFNTIASGGVSDMSDIINLKKMGVYGAIIGKAYYTGAIDLAEAVKEAEL